MIRIEEKNNYSENDNKLMKRLEELPQDFWDFKNCDTSGLVHGIHSYPAMMIYPISRNILKILTEIKNFNTILDPFSGSGTVLVEAMLQGINTIYGNDLNPLARLITKVKTTIVSKEELLDYQTKIISNLEEEYKKSVKLINNIDEYIINEKEIDITEKKGWGDNAPKYIKEFLDKYNYSIEVPNFNNLGFWFRPKVIIELQIIKNEILKIENKDIRDIFLIAFSETIRLVSNKRNGEFKMYRMPPEKIHTFNPDVKNTFIKILSKNIEKEIEFSKEIKNTKTNITITKNDAKTLEDIPNNSIELVITSPPYGDSKTTVAYGEFSRLSLQWLELFGTTEDSIKGIDKSLMGGKKLKNSPDFIIHSETFNKSFEKILKIDEKRAYDVYSFYYDLEKIIETLSKKMTKNSYQFWVVGNRTVKQENLKTDIIIREISKHYNIQYLCTIDRNILNKVMPSKNSPTNITGETVTTMVNEHIVVLKKE